MIFHIKDPGKTIRYGFDWSPWLLAIGDHIIESSWAVTDGLTAESSQFSGYTASVQLSAGMLGDDYKATNHIKTAAGREDCRSTVIRVRVCDDGFC